ncbi:neo-calmodulin-like isoform X2 [Convolutriloba macropyga]|uniref:neo-calmodulin-like isoform X2 n=1 Tax=Convolutriloba macropyga TaxID=536237 RepID=UPI003F51B31A
MQRNCRPEHYEDEMFSANEIKEFYEIFNSVDRDKSSFNSPEEDKAGLCLPAPSATTLDVRKILAEAGTDRSGDITFQEFLDLLKKRQQEMFEEELLRIAFYSFDKNHSQYIEPDDVKGMLLALGERISDSDAEEMIRLADRDGDGRVSFEDYKELIQSLTE